MEVVIVDDTEEIARLAADAITEAIDHRPDPVIGLATGSSPLPGTILLRRGVTASRRLDRRYG